MRNTDRVAAALDEAAQLVQGSAPGTSLSPRPGSPAAAAAVPAKAPAPSAAVRAPASPPQQTRERAGESPAGRLRAPREDSRGRSGQLEVRDTSHVLSKAAGVLAACRAHYQAAARRQQWEVMAVAAERAADELGAVLAGAAAAPTEAELRALVESSLARHALGEAGRAGLSEAERVDVVRFGSASITAGQLDALVTQLARDLAADEATLAATRAEVALLEADAAHAQARLVALRDDRAASAAQRALAEEEAELDRALAAARAEAQELAHRSHALRSEAEAVAPVFALDISAGRAVRLEGWLSKQGHIVRSWKRRYFSLAVQPSVSAVLYYFKRQTDLRPAGLAELRGCTVGELPPGAGVGAFAFHVSLPSGRVYSLRADSQAERAAWLIEIQKAAFA